MRPSPAAELWYHALALTGTQGFGALPLYDRGYPAAVRAERVKRGMAMTALERSAGEFRLAFEADSAFEMLHFLPLTAVSASPDQLLGEVVPQIGYTLLQTPGQRATLDRFAERQAKVARLVSSMFERSHYRQAPVNDPVSSLVLDRYVESLDGNRSYFLASDIAEFEKYRYQLDDAVASGKLEPAFAIYNRFQQRNRERMRYAIDLLKTEPDFTIEEAFEFDREKAPWAASTAELDELWRKRVKNDALSLILTDKTWVETKDVLAKRYDRVLKRSEQVTADDVFEELHERVRPRVRSALQLLLASQFRGIQHRDEPFV